MRIGMMLRAIDEKGGVGVYTRNLTEELLSIDRKNEYILFFNSPSQLGRFVHYANVTECLFNVSNKVFWDQVAIPYLCWKHNVDVVFHPKFTVPLLAPCKAVMVLHGTGWFTTSFFRKLDVAYIKAIMPFYLAKASKVLSVSRIGVDFYNEKYRLPHDKVQVVYFGPAKQFKRIVDQHLLQQVKAKYSLPDQFVLNLTKHKDAERKNIRTVLEAYRLCHGKTPHKLVIGGTDCHKFRDDYAIPAKGYGKDILFPGWIDQMDLPAVYSLADLFLYPSNMEAFPIPITEAMACGTPIVTSNINGLVEIGGEATLQVDPNDPVAISEAMLSVLADNMLSHSLSTKGLARSAMFSWETCARETLQVLQNVHEMSMSRNNFSKRQH